MERDDIEKRFPWIWVGIGTAAATAIYAGIRMYQRSVHVSNDPGNQTNSQNVSNDPANQVDKEPNVGMAANLVFTRCSKRKRDTPVIKEIDGLTDSDASVHDHLEELVRVSSAKKDRHYTVRRIYRIDSRVNQTEFLNRMAEVKFLEVQTLFRPFPSLREAKKAVSDGNLTGKDSMFTDRMGKRTAQWHQYNAPGTTFAVVVGQTVVVRRKETDDISAIVNDANNETPTTKSIFDLVVHKPHPDQKRRGMRHVKLGTIIPCEDAFHPIGIIEVTTK